MRKAFKIEFLFFMVEGRFGKTIANNLFSNVTKENFKLDWRAPIVTFSSGEIGLPMINCMKVCLKLNYG